MHEKTKNDLEMLHQWIVNTVQADPHLQKLDSLLPQKQDYSGAYYRLKTQIGSLSLVVFQADKIADAVPYLEIVRKAGFQRQNDKTRENEANRSLSWDYKAEDGTPLTVTLQLRADGACQYVEVGEKTVPDVRLLCGEELENWKKKCEKNT